MLRKYFAAYVNSAEVEDPSLLDHMDFRLVSFYDMKSAGYRYDEYFFKKYRNRYTSIMLDSGAFSAWNKHTEVPFRDYLAYCKKWADKIDLFVNLDIIPREKTERAAAAAAEGGYANYRRMVEALGEVGIPKERIIHVYHQFEPIDVLKKMVIEDQMAYIGLSADNSERTESKRKFFKECMKIVLDDQGRPKCKTHAFGLSGFRILKEFPFYSADSQTWALQADSHCIFVPKFRDEVETRFGDPIETRWDFTAPESYDIGYLRDDDDFFMKKKFATRSKIGSYRIRLHAYIYDLDKISPFYPDDPEKLLIGESIIHRRHNRDRLKPNEFELNPNSKIIQKKEAVLNDGRSSSSMWTDEVLSYGFIHKLQWRMKANLMTTNNFVRQLDPVGYDEFHRTRRP